MLGSKVSPLANYIFQKTVVKYALVMLKLTDGKVIDVQNGIVGWSALPSREIMMPIGRERRMLRYEPLPYNMLYTSYLVTPP